jgi:hypothetical protein
MMNPQAPFSQATTMRPIVYQVPMMQPRPIPMGYPVPMNVMPMPVRPMYLQRPMSPIIRPIPNQTSQVIPVVPINRMASIHGYAHGRSPTKRRSSSLFSDISTRSNPPTRIIPSLLSQAYAVLKSKLTLSIHSKDSNQYPDSFDGKQAVVSHGKWIHPSRIF